MNTLLNDHDEDIDDRDNRQYNRPQDREITLGTTMILGIFFALAVLCAAFFGFGYSTGRHSALTTTGPAAATSTSYNSLSKPGAGSLFGQPVSQPAVSTQPAYQPAPPPAYVAPTTVAERPLPTPQRVVAAEPDLPPAPTQADLPKPARVLPVAASVTPSPPPMPVSTGTGAFMVQVAAVSHQEDGDLLVTTLKRRGYGVAIHQEPQDKLLHVQVGPFANKKDADAMRQRLLADGFNAIVK